MSLPKSLTRPQSGPRPASRGTFRRLATATGTVLLLAGCGGSGEGEEGGTLLWVSSFVTQEHPYSQGFEAWMDAVTEATDGEVTFETSYNGALCQSAESLDCAGSRTADISMIAAAYTPEIVLANIGGVAFQSGDPQAVGDAMNALYAKEEAFQAEYADRGVRMLYAFGDSKPVIATTTEVDSLGALDGLTARTGGAMSTGVVPLGIKPVAIAPEEIYESMERGVVDASVLPVPSQVDYRLQEVAPHFYDIGAFTGVYSTLAHVISTDTWESLPADVQEAMTAASEEIAGAFQARFVVPDIERGCGLLADAGRELQEIGPVEAGEAWAAEGASQQRDDWIELATESGVDDPEAYFDRYVAALESAEATGEGTPENHEICAGTAG
ncbi:TRAP transporter substrate-binding protein DctP [Nocardioides campestrisoli]|uniref:TRAP transporter substrate-binding protein DctP n=1 Tax=Nocardioides campestrisoli TaxID=2736757 RepID=UPI00163DACDC|nr:TRAP transporter substrate-binding protein DctP [Nocardioides campestrisoli]